VLLVLGAALGLVRILSPERAPHAAGERRALGTAAAPEPAASLADASFATGGRDARASVTEVVPPETAPAPAPPPVETPARPRLCVLRDGLASAGVEILDGRPPLALAAPENPLGALRGLGDAGSPDLVFGPEAAPTTSAWTEADGCARLEGFGAAARPVWMRAAEGSWTRLEIGSEAEPPVRARIGSAAVEGFAYREDGSPAAGLCLLLNQGVLEGEARLTFVTRTDTDGAFAFEGLAGDGLPLWLQPTWMGADLFALRLERGERKRQDIGSARGEARLDGQVRFPSGDLVRSPQRLFVTGLGGTRSAPLDARGFALRVPIGVQELHLGSESGPLLGRVEMDGDTHVELVLPGTVVRGRVTYVGTKHARARGPEQEVRIQLLDEAGNPVPARFAREEGRYFLVGLAPGTWRLRTLPWPLAEPGGSLTLEVDGQTDELVVDLRITDP